MSIPGGFLCWRALPWSPRSFTQQEVHPPLGTLVARTRGRAAAIGLPLSLLVGIAMVSGCASHSGENTAIQGPGKTGRTHPKPEPRFAGAVPASFTGVIKLFDEDQRFVLIAGEQNASPEPGTELRAYRGQTETALLRVGLERRRSWVIADVLKGEPGNGDRVIQLNNQPTESKAN